MKDEEGRKEQWATLRQSSFDATVGLSEFPSSFLSRLWKRYLPKTYYPTSLISPHETPFPNIEAVR